MVIFALVHYGDYAISSAGGAPAYMGGDELLELMDHPEVTPLFTTLTLLLRLLSERMK